MKFFYDCWICMDQGHILKKEPRYANIETMTSIFSERILVCIDVVEEPCVCRNSITGLPNSENSSG